MTPPNFGVLRRLWFEAIRSFSFHYVPVRNCVWKDESLNDSQLTVVNPNTSKFKSVINLSFDSQREPKCRQSEYKQFYKKRSTNLCSFLQASSNMLLTFISKYNFVHECNMNKRKYTKQTEFAWNNKIINQSASVYLFIRLIILTG